MLDERSQPQTPPTVWFHLYEIFSVGKSTETENGLLVAKGWEEEGIGSEC